MEIRHFKMEILLSKNNDSVFQNKNFTVQEWRFYISKLKF